ncbi:MAG: LysM peptidoglycan-binding domain-containing protein, partial [Anaerolineae bacterium]|nr:LysM peptidoglycan-binding domain-containing protein [Anaerolineae bacterium]
MIIKRFIPMLLLMLLAACNFAPAPQGDVSPTVEAIVYTDTPTAPTPTPSLSPTPTLPDNAPLVETATPSPTPGPPTLPPPPTATLGPYEHTIASGDTLLYIIQLYGYRDASVIPEVVAINENILNADTLPGVGSVISIPRQTITPTPEGLELTPTTFVPEQAVAPTDEQTGLNVDTSILEHIVLEGETIVDIAANNATTLEVLARLNPDIAFFGCNFEIPSGGPNCGPLLQVGQVVRVPAPTPTPT